MTEPAILTNVAVVTGGRLPQHSSASRSSVGRLWVPETKRVDGREFLVADRLDRRFEKFVDSKFNMLDTLIKLRNYVVDEAIAGANTHGDDPMATQDGQIQPHGIKKKHHIDDVQDILMVTVQSEQRGSHQVAVLKDWYHRAKLFVELTVSNLKLMYEDVVGIATPGEFKPVVTEPNVTWMHDRHCVVTRFVHAGKRKFKSIHIDKSGDTYAVQEDVNRKARKLQMWHDKTRQTTGDESDSM
jgi:hypothetical protein